MLVGLSAAGILVLQQLPFNGPAERYEQRFGSLHILTRPSLLLYPDFEAATDIKDASPDSVLQGASMTFAKVGIFSMFSPAAQFLVVAVHARTCVQTPLS